MYGVRGLICDAARAAVLTRLMLSGTIDEYTYITQLAGSQRTYSTGHTYLIALLLRVSRPIDCDMSSYTHNPDFGLRAPPRPERKGPIR